MRKKTIGEVLKLARTNQGLSLEELSKKTDIQQDLLEALERNDYDLLPSPFYARSFLRKYAWAVEKIKIKALFCPCSIFSYWLQLLQLSWHTIFGAMLTPIR